MNESQLAAELSAEIPKIAAFQSMTQTQLAKATGVDAARWCRYFKGQYVMTETSLERFAKDLDMQPYSLLIALNIRREQVLAAKTVNAA